MSTAVTLAKSAAKKLFAAVGVDIRKFQPAPPAPPSLEEVFAEIDPPFRAALLSIYRGEPQLGLDGQRHEINTIYGIGASQGMWLYDLCCARRPNTTLEIGVSYGVSTLFFLAAIAKNKAGNHTGVDPHVRSHWHGIALAHVRALGMESSFRYMEELSCRAAIDFARENRTFDVIHIDGSHRFDDVMTDFYLFAPLCPVGGYIILDDMWMNSVQTAASFVRANRSDFVEVPTPISNMCVFERIREDVRDWDHFRTFAVAGNSGSDFAKGLPDPQVQKVKTA
jgi:predicted O-methyltransferase YrrM